jgi:hypothetical protein
MRARMFPVRLVRTGIEEHARAVFLAVALLPPLIAASVLWVLPVGDLGADRIAMAARDYTDMWAAGHLVALGSGDTLFDLTAFNVALRSMFGAGFPHQVWPYPPPILLLSVPLSTLPLLPGFLIYTGCTAGLLWLALRFGGLTRAACTAVLFSPAVADNALTGQNGSLTGALLCGGLLLVQRRPVLAGAMLGALIIKPQFALLVPICLVASSSWRALLATVIMACLLIGLSGILFGFDAWWGFFLLTRPAIATILEAPWQAIPAQQIFASPLMAARSLGATLQVAWCLQGAVALLCAAVAWRTWRTSGVDPLLRAALTSLLAMAASPWVHSYDMIPLAVAVVVLVTTSRHASQIVLGFAWLWPGAVVLLPIPLPLSVASVASVAWLAWRQMRRSSNLARGTWW